MQNDIHMHSFQNCSNTSQKVDNWRQVAKITKAFSTGAVFRSIIHSSWCIASDENQSVQSMNDFVGEA